MSRNNKNLKSIAELLPEGITEESVDKIAKLVDECISEEVDSRMKALSNQVFGFIRLKMDSLKEAALEELSEENEMYRNAQLFENVRTLMAMELSTKDVDSAIREIEQDNSDLSDDIEFLTNELDKALQENSRLEAAASILEAKVKTYSNKVKKLDEQIKEHKSSENDDFESSERAIVITEADTIEMDSLKSTVKETKDYSRLNEALTSEIVDLCTD